MHHCWLEEGGVQLQENRENKDHAHPGQKTETSALQPQGTAFCTQQMRLEMDSPQALSVENLAWLPFDLSFIL